ncbi:MAG: phage tail tip lysozyme [Candidatus Saccharimonadales bacterium]
MINIKKTLLLARYILVISVLCMTSITNTAVATYDEQFFAGNDILFYSPSDTGCIDSGSSGTPSSPASKDNEETVAKFITSTNFAGNDNKPLNAVQMAAVLGNFQQESGFNPSAGLGKTHQGIAQWEPSRWEGIADPKTDLNKQLDHVKKEFDGSKKNSLSEFWESSSPEDLDKATYAITRNYEGAVSTKNVSTSWTSDAEASSTLQDWGKRRTNASAMYDKYGNLAASGSDYIPGDGCGELVSGGMTLSEAKKFMDEYKSLEPKYWPVGTAGTKYEINGTDAVGGPLANCVAFSQYFINRYSGKKYSSPGNGESVVGELIGLDFKNGGHTPNIYAVFSKSGGKYGHTGVVLGINKEKDEIIIGEAAYGEGFDWIDARSYSLSVFSGDDYTYAYTSSTPSADSDSAKKDDK